MAQKNPHGESILVVGPSWVGDMVMAQSLFRLLKQQRRNCLITVLAPNWTRALLSRMPEVDAMEALPFAHGELKWGARKRLGERLKSHHFDQAIVLPGSLKSALIPYWAGIPRRTGYRREMRFGLLNDMRKLDKQHLPLNVQRFVALGLPANQRLPAEIPLPKLEVSNDAINTALSALQIDYPEKPVLAICPGAEFGSAKQWSPDYFAEIANRVMEQDWEVWLFGSKNDQTVSAAVNAACDDRCIDLSGLTQLEQAIDLMSLATAAISNDSGLMHVAAALQRPVIGLFGSSSPAFTPPLGELSTALWLGVDCSPCFKRECPLGHMKCLVDLKPDQVFDTLVQSVNASEG